MAFGHTENAAIALLVDTHDHQHRNVLDPTRPAALQYDAVQVNVRILVLVRPVAPALDMLIDLLVQLANGARTYPPTPQSFGNVLYTAHRHAGQVHLDQGFFDGSFTPPVTLDNGGLEGLTAQLGYLELHALVCRERS